MLAALIIAAGKTDFSDSFDPMKKVGRITAVQRLILVLKQAGAQRVVIVGGADADDLEKHVSRMGVVLLRESPNFEMLDSVKLGLGYLTGKCGGVLVTPVDIPLFSPATCRLLAQSGAPLAVPVYSGLRGHPVYIASSLFPHIAGYNGKGGLSGAMEAVDAERRLVPVDDTGAFIDIEVVEDFSAVVEDHALSRLRPELRISVAREEVCFGPGLAHLLTLIDDTGSVQLACRQMGISYSKGWKMIQSMEANLGFRAVERQQGGKYGGQSFVTPEGRDFLQKYAAFSDECLKTAERLFEKHFGER